MSLKLRGEVREHHQPTGEGFKDVSLWRVRERRGLRTETCDIVGMRRGAANKGDFRVTWEAGGTTGAKEENLSQETGLFNCVDCCWEVKENEDWQEKVSLASVVTHVLVKGKLWRQVLENSCYKEEQRNKLAVASLWGVKGSLFSLKAVYTRAYVCADGNELVKVIQRKHLHQDMQPTSIKTQWRLE